MKRRRFVFCRDKTTSFQPPQMLNRAICSPFPKFGISDQLDCFCSLHRRGEGDGDWEDGGLELDLTWPVPASSDGDRRRRPETEQSELLEATATGRRRGC